MTAIDPSPKYDYSDLLLRPKRSTLGSRKEVDMIRRITFRNSHRTYVGTPIVAANMDTVGTIDMALTLCDRDLSTALHKHYDVDELTRFFDDLGEHDAVFYSCGILDTDVEKLRAVQERAPINYLCIDVANGYSERFVDKVKMFRELCPTAAIMAGNVVTADQTQELILAGADIVKVGIGPGSVCTTRLITGVGYPQASAVLECADAAHGLGGHVCADGGCVHPGDVAKAFGLGADFVMLGGMLAGHDECGGNIATNPDDGFDYMEFYGMSSESAMNKHSGGVANYRAAEGKTVMIPYRGEVEGTINEILGGVRSACTYVGARRLKDLPKCSTFSVVRSTHNRVFE